MTRLARAWARRLVHWIRFRLQSRAGDGLRVVIFPTNQPWDPASNLRAWLLGPELRKLGYRVTLVPESFTQRGRRRVLARESPDVVLLQQSRHPLNRPRLCAPYPCVFDVDDADVLDPNCRDVVIECARESRAVVAGSRFIRDCLAPHTDDVEVIWTSTPAPDGRPGPRSSDRKPIVAWAHANPLLYPAEAAFVQAMLMRLAKRCTFEFWLFGAEESAASHYLEPIRKSGATATAFPLMTYEAYLAQLTGAAVGIQPVMVSNEFSRGKSFGKILGYLASDVAVVASDAVDHPLFFESGRNGFLATTEDEWDDAIVGLLEDVDLREKIVDAAHADFARRLTTQVTAPRVANVLRRAAG